MKGFGYFISAVVGGVVAGIGVHMVEKKKCDILVKEAKESALKYYMEQIQNTEEPPVEEEPVVEESIPANEVSYDDLVTEYVTESDFVAEGVSAAIKLPYPIPSVQFGMTGNEKILLTYYADGVLVDENYKVVPEDDILDFVGGRSFVKMFGDYGEMGVVHIRNDSLNADFEIDQDPRNWRDFKKTVPSFPAGRGPFDDDNT